MATISVVGAGLMGTALTFPAADNGHDIHLIGTHLDTAIIEELKAGRAHPRLRRTVLPHVTPHFHIEIPALVPGADLVVIGVNSRGVRWASGAVGPHLQPGQRVLMVTKGLENTGDGSLQLLPDLFRAGLPDAIRDSVRIAAIGGPSIAGELAARRHTGVVFTSRHGEILPELRRTFATSYYHVWTSTDMPGVEVCVALKNIYTLAVGLAAGMVEAETPPDPAGAQMYNTAAALFAQGLAETAYLVQHMGGGLETVFSLPGAGDLYVTAQGGRNTRLARLLGKGMPFSSAIEEMPGETIEGVDALLSVAPAVERAVEMGKLDGDAMPLLRKLYRIMTRHEPIAFEWDSFFGKLPFGK
ncbi:MAG: glycerol-3-phosphate dehydrogenase [Anaerolineae bacterium]|nr:glycerol-3-phosphate dehydrogenase [Anaerolineae bacterium]